MVWNGNERSRGMRDRIINALLIIIIVLNFITIGATIYRINNESKPIPHQVTAKNETNGHCYVQTWVEVPPEDYIGLDVGDEFEVTK